MESFQDLSGRLRLPYVVRRVPDAAFAALLPVPTNPQPGDIAVARLEKIGKNARLELRNGRNGTLHDGDVIAVAFGNRYATAQFEGYSTIKGDECDLLSMGGLCGRVVSRHAGVGEPTKLRLLGLAADAHGRALQLSDFALPESRRALARPLVTGVCGTSMDSGKTHTAMSLVLGLRRAGVRVAGIKLTGTASGRDTWNLFDAGARPALDFIDGGLPSTYQCSLQQLLDLNRLLVDHAAGEGAEHVVMEIADGVLEDETSALLQSREFTSTVDRWLFATGDPVAALGGIGLIRRWGVEPVAISGLISMSPLAMKEAQRATGVRCVTAQELQAGKLGEVLPRAVLSACPATTNGAVVGASHESRTHL